MRKNKFILASVAALMAVSPMLPLSSQAHTVQAADTNAVNKMVMHTAVAYDKDGNSTGVKYNAFSYARLLSTPVKIDGTIYYKVADKDQYLKATNIDGVTRRITHNTYIYRTSTRRTSYQNRWKLYKGQTITTYGGSYRFKNGKHYFRVGGPAKQYVKSYNLGPVIRANTTMAPNSNNTSSNTTTNKPTDNTTTNNTQPVGNEETTVTVTASFNVNIFDNQGNTVRRNVPKGTKFVVDRLEVTPFADRFPTALGREGLYRIKGTDTWILAVDVTAAKKLPLHDYDLEHNSYIKFPQATDLYNASGSKINTNGDYIRKQSGQYKVDKLLYIWVPSENKAELFYHLVGKEVASNNGHISFDDGYVKASDVQFMSNSKAITPSNTAAEAEAAAKK
ncbi:SLAP domain-containing protein [Lactobacillus amylovorus]|uniref:SLAP domain-containing protein n=1 Tax=Lactobacillus amylovorus TaxID=1604 RepID=UPI00232D0A2A|nr:SLAP domain-containing protein [Lactobacillus amylovorus]MDB6249577.1 SLAP domain-containing protein [Lactobacillus amylovorus]MDB6264984.1 SLAP domain-containing protein [Lactobacillus amylovorus]